jgi:PAS domain S-box-containing protein
MLRLNLELLQPGDTSHEALNSHNALATIGSTWLTISAAQAKPVIHPSTHLAINMTLDANVLQSIDDVIFAKDLEGRYIASNGAWARLIGKEIAKALGLKDSDLFPAELALSIRSNDQAMLASGTSRSNEEWVQYPDDRKALLETRKSPLKDSNGAIIGLVGVSRELVKPR